MNTRDQIYCIIVKRKGYLKFLFDYGAGIRKKSTLVYMYLI